MAIRDRGMVKWHAAFQLPELVKAQRNLWQDTERIERPIIDEYQWEEFDLRIAYAMEWNYIVKVKLWSDGFMTDVIGRIHYVDSITRQIRIEVRSGQFEGIPFEDIVEVEVID
ncbi:YolD-like family protein [Neobacillus muris]|uniref:YolD-like family protein n=1 Tax=Neobacillus muris TaxID=2941334 RepID=UPI00204053D3|nr:YolD-like family protein [Neobacillus muris]